MKKKILDILPTTEVLRKNSSSSSRSFSLLNILLFRKPFKKNNTELSFKSSNYKYGYYQSRHSFLHSGPENLKIPGQKKFVKSNKSISRKIHLTKFHFLQFQKWPKINL